MDVKELIKLNSREVRGNSNLMAIYINVFESQFGYKPNCAGCTFNSDFQKLKNAVLTPKQKTIIKMEKTFKLYQVKGEILTYKRGKKTVRQYDNRMTEEFAIGFLTNGTDEQIEERKKLFKSLPKGLNKEKEPEKEPAPKTEEKQESVKPRAKRAKKVNNE